MFNPIQRLPFALRVTLLAMTMFSVLGRPMYSTWCETHQLGHELAALAHEKFRPDSPLERQLDAEHARGAHGLLHSDDGGVYAGTAAVVAAPAVHVESVLNPLAIVLPAPVQRIGRLLRPPIA
ncbi:MAG TPA: hypothetical protein VMH77_04590 [Steroidobacteraceae bacterium]|nr:hypothetical protein [Steroidobacteraceae bacterium]